MVSQGHIDARTTMPHFHLNSYFSISLYHRELVINNRSSNIERKTYYTPFDHCSLPHRNTLILLYKKPADYR